MEITIKFNTDNPVVKDNILGESKHILNKVLEHIENDNKGKYNLRDSNGNTVGYITLEVA